VEIGGNERYVSVCRLHFKRGEAQSSAAPPPAAGGG
jgi:thymidine kinase